MNYERRYNDALARAKEQLDGAKVFDYDKEQIAHDIRNTVYNIFPELKENKKEWIEKIRQELKSYLGHRKTEQISESDAVHQWIAWLEKQDEPKDYGSIDPHFGKPINNKVEPKFKERDWVFIEWANKKDLFQIKNVDCFGYSFDEYFTIPFMFEDVLSEWTIKDAKEGDVLAGKIDGDSYILIYKQIKDGWIETYGHYYDSVDRFCVPSQLFCREVKGTFRPTTKEQKEFLFQKMRKAGYEWDADKKELKKL